jgi:hypothetical protein
VIVEVVPAPNKPTTPVFKSKFAKTVVVVYINPEPIICKKLFVPFFANTLCVYATPLVALTTCPRECCPEELLPVQVSAVKVPSGAVVLLGVTDERFFTKLTL